MQLSFFSKFLCTCGLALFLVNGLSAQQFKALLVVQTAGWQHESTFDAIPALHALASRHSFSLDLKQRAMPIQEEQMMGYDVLIMVNTTGDVFNDEEQAIIEKFIQAGKGWVGVHAAADTEYEWTWYTDMVGHMFYIHPHVQTAMLDVHDADFPGMETWPERMMWTDEYYEYLDGAKRPGFNYILSVDESTYATAANWGPGKVAKGHGDFHPVSWYHDYDGGRAWYTNLGHVPAVFQEDSFLRHLYGGIYWAATGSK